MYTQQTIGILGGMGPEATALLLRLIIEATPAGKDADHLPVSLYSLPQIPDRTAAILHHGPSPVPLVKHGLEVLARTPAAFVLIPCNTIFHFYREFAENAPLPVVHLIRAVSLALQSDPRHKRQRTVGILATSGTRQAAVYDRFLNAEGFRVVYPSAEMQASLMQAIYAIKGGERRVEEAKAAARALREAGAEKIILGCTELSIIYDQLQHDDLFVDSLRVLARVGIDIAQNIAAVEDFVIE